MDDVKTIVTVVSACIAGFSFLFAVLSHRWHRKESRAATLSKILNPMIRTAQSLKKANDLRRKTAILKASFPNPGAAPEAAQRINGMIDDYSEVIRSTETTFRESEAEFASSYFRFPDRITRLVRTAKESLSEYGRLVNDGQCDRAELQFAKFRDDYGQITKLARGWRLLDPLEGMKRRLTNERVEAANKNGFELSEEDMNAIMDLVHRRATSQGKNTFAVHPPKKLVDNPDLSKSDRVIDELKDSVFVIVFQDGTSKLLSFVELMVFTFNLIVLAQSHLEVSRMIEAAKPTGDRNFNMTYQFSLDDIMRPEMAKLLLEKIEFSNVASDDVQ